MVKYDRNKIRELLNYRSSGTDKNKQGRNLEDLSSYIFEQIPGISVITRNQPDRIHNQEMDLVLWNTQLFNGLHFFPNIIPVECKNMSETVNGMTLNWFVKKIRNSGLNFGILVARDGISGNELKETFAYHELANALRDGVQVIIITGQDLEKIADPCQFVEMLKQKFVNLVIPIKVSKTRRPK